METRRKSKSIPLSLAVILIVLVALAGAIAFYVQYDQRQKFMNRSEQALVEQQTKTAQVFNRIEANLAKISESESMIRQDFKGPEDNGNLSQEDRINNEITYIQQLLDENNQLIASLKGNISERDNRISAYEKNVKELKTRIGTYQSQLEILVAEKGTLMNSLDSTQTENDKLASKVSLLGEDIAMKSSLIADQEQQLQNKDNEYYTAFYTVGSYKTLRDKDVLEKEGGFLGINRTITMTDKVDNSQFQKIDQREVTRIPIFSKQFEMVNDRDTSSYSIEYGNDMAEWLNITDPKNFWNKSRYLVIVVREDGSGELAQSR